MTNYSDNQSHCRVDFFKESGKWYTTEEVIFNPDYYSIKPVGEGWLHPIDKFKVILKEHLQGRLKNTTAVCLDPYFEDSWPLMVKVDD